MVVRRPPSSLEVTGLSATPSRGHMIQADEMRSEVPREFLAGGQRKLRRTVERLYAYLLDGVQGPSLTPPGLLQCCGLCCERQRDQGWTTLVDLSEFQVYLECSAFLRLPQNRGLRASSPAMEGSPLAHTVVDLFAGVGGLSEGFRLAGCSVVGAVEWDKESAECYKANHRRHGMRVPVVQNDIRLVTSQDLLREFNLTPGQLTFLVGGSPCQGFST